VSALNRALQARLNPSAPDKPEVHVSGETVFRLGDRLIVGKNNYQTLCFNGETGEIVEISPTSLTLRLEDAQGERLVDYDRDDWSQLQLAYAITSHRAQGSEWDNVVVVVSQSHYLMLQRNLLYTALTRARKRAVIVVSGGLENKQTGRIFKTALEVAVANEKIAQRYSGLAERLQVLLPAHV
jgi:exodeoxyribonuclease V alpha subunit